MTDGRNRTASQAPGIDVERHSRQLLLPELGEAGQRALQRARALVVGCGGLGAPVIQYLAGAGVGSLTLYDDDVVERSNLNRQLLHREADVGRRKAERAREWVQALDGALEVQAHVERVTTQNVRALVAAHDIVLDCTDGLPNKYLLNDACVREDTPLIHGAVTAFDGQLLVVPGASGPCLRCLFEEIPPPGVVPSCGQAGVLGAVCGIVGSMMANEAIKLLSAAPALRPASRFFVMDARLPSLRALRIERRADCPTCGDEPEYDARDDDDYRLSCRGI